MLKLIVILHFLQIFNLKHIVVIIRLRLFQHLRFSRSVAALIVLNSEIGFVKMTGRYIVVESHQLPFQRLVVSALRLDELYVVVLTN